MMVNIHLLPVEVNESVIILQIKPQLGAYNNTNDLKDISLFAFMNKGKFVVLLSQRQQTIACVLEKVFSALSSLLLWMIIFPSFDTLDTQTLNITWRWISRGKIFVIFCFR